MKNKLISLIFMGIIGISILGCGSTADMTAPAVSATMDNYNDITVESDTDKASNNVEINEEIDAEATSITTNTDVMDTDANTTNVNMQLSSNKKIVYTASVELETLDYNKMYKDLVNIIEKYEGYIESESYDNPNSSYMYDVERKGFGIDGQSYLTIRIPSKNYFLFMKDGLVLGNILNKQQETEDKTIEYSSNQAHIDILNKRLSYYDSQLKKLSNDLDTAISEFDSPRYEIILSDMEQMSRMKADVESELIPYKNANNTIDAESDYSTIRLSISEVKEFTIPEPEPVTFNEKFTKACKDSWKNVKGFLEGLVIFLVYTLPWLLGLGIILFAGLMLLNKITTKKDKISAKTDNTHTLAAKQNDTDEDVE